MLLIHFPTFLGCRFDKITKLHFAFRSLQSQPQSLHKCLLRYSQKVFVNQRLVQKWWTGAPEPFETFVSQFENLWAQAAWKIGVAMPSLLESKADGDFGKKSILALQKFLNQEGTKYQLGWFGSEKSNLRFKMKFQKKRLSKRRINT